MATWLTQTGRFLQLTTPLGENELAPIEFTGKEALSSLFKFNLKMISGNIAIKPNDIIGKTVTIQLNISQESPPRYFNGIVNQFQAGDIIDQNIRYYYATIMPWLSFLHYTSDCRIFQNKSVIDIAKKIFDELSFSNYDLSNLTKNYPKRDYCVQYRETALNFLQRLFQEEGIFYFFKHEQSKHTLMLADKSTVLKSCAESVVFDNGSHKGSGLTGWKRRYGFYSGKYEQGDYNFEQPSASLNTKQQSTAKLTLAQKYGLYDYPGYYKTSDVGKNYTQQHFEAQEVEYDISQGSGNYPSFTTGGKISIVGAPATSDDGDYILMEVYHHAYDQSYLSSDNESQGYSNDFSCFPASNTYRHPYIIKKPFIIGAQTAIVVGPEGEELHTNQYGQVKVQFHWDRQGKKDAYSSCWVRVAQSMAGNKWGSLFMPRIGQEVIVQFLEGNPDRPIIIGSVYNTDNLPPYQLPADQTCSGIKTRSTKNGSAGNELRFDDALGKEELYLFAQKDLTRTVTNNETVTVLQGDQTIQIQAGSSNLQAAKSIQFTVGSNSILINTEGVFINGDKVNINSN